MSNELVGKIMKSLLFISTLAILAGALFKLQHWAYGEQILMSGFIVNFILRGYEISRLKKIVSKYEKSDIKLYD